MSYFERQALDGDFSDIGRVHDWRNYISDEVREMWGTFSSAQKLALFRQADQCADRENWE